MQVLNDIIEEVAEKYGLTKTQARKLILKSLDAVIVQELIFEQVAHYLHEEQLPVDVVG
jgi:predicted nucleic acid-binding protein